MKRIEKHQNYYLMSVLQIKAALIKQIEGVEDEKLLKMFAAMLNVYTESHQEEVELDRLVNGLPDNPKWKQMTESQLIERLDKSVNQYEKGEYITIEELKNKSNKW